MILIGVHSPEAYLKAMENMVVAERFPNRAEAIRTAVRDFIKEEFYRAEKELDVVAYGDMNTIRYQNNEGDWVTSKVLRKLW